MAIETGEEYGGAGASFMSAILVIEGAHATAAVALLRPELKCCACNCATELAKVDPSVSVLCDVHNTLVNTLFRTYANDALKEKYLPRLASGKVQNLRWLALTEHLADRAAR